MGESPKDIRERLEWEAVGHAPTPTYASPSELTTMAIILSLCCLLSGLMLLEVTKRREFQAKIAAELERHYRDEGLEVSLGEFESTLACRSGFGEGEMHVIEFNLAAVVFEVEPSRSEIAEYFANHEQRIRGQVDKVIRSSTQAELSDPSLTRLKRQMCVAVNEVLDDATVADVVFDHFRIYRVAETAYR